jgi:Flp pilus assembly pilin Flp
MRDLIDSFWNDRSAATSIEYGAVAVFISVAILVALHVISPSVRDLYLLIAAAK